jgi:osmoprotectant transport system ATP-binding protein
MIRVKHLTKQYSGKEVVSDVNFEVHRDETLVLLGTSGSGKTTTLKMINKLIVADEGSIFIDGKNVLEESPENLRRQIGFVLQNIGLFPHYTVEQNVSAVPRLLGWDEDRIIHRLREVMEKLNLSYVDFARVYPKELSGGQQQRVGLARALAANPRVLLMDEPFSALDPITRKNIRKEFRELDELKNKTIVMVTHDVQEAFEMGDRICLMNEGKIIQSGSPRDILLRRQHEFVSSFLSDQQLTLELKSVPIHHYWNNIEVLDRPLTALPVYKASQSLFDVLEHSLERSDEKALIVRDDHGIEKVTSFQLLMNAFSSYKEQYQ